jgi:uncharacterized membrane protein YjgN (DUF898 family)
MMGIKNKIIIFLLVLLNSCGFSSIYNNVENDNLKLNIISAVGDKDLNNQISNYAKLYSNLNSENEYQVTINSYYDKEVIAKNASGVATDYRVIANVNFIVKFNGKDENINFQESIKMVNNTDIFEQNNYEKNLKKNFASSIVKKLIIKILRTNDN